MSIILNLKLDRCLQQRFGWSQIGRTCYHNTLSLKYIHQMLTQNSGLYELTVPQEIICWITIAIATAKRVNPERIITALE